MTLLPPWLAVYLAIGSLIGTAELCKITALEWEMMRDRGDRVLVAISFMLAFAIVVLAWPLAFMRRN